MIIACTLGFSYPLSLYRDIAKVWKDTTVFRSLTFADHYQLARASALALLSMAVIRPLLEPCQSLVDVGYRLSWPQS